MDRANRLIRMRRMRLLRRQAGRDQQEDGDEASVHGIRIMRGGGVSQLLASDRHNRLTESRSSTTRAVPRPSSRGAA